MPALDYIGRVTCTINVNGSPVWSWDTYALVPNAGGDGYLETSHTRFLSLDEGDTVTLTITQTAAGFADGTDTVFRLTAARLGADPDA